ncbi:DMT family transporter [Jatrophihabitans sp. DSM 45814]
MSTAIAVAAGLGSAIAYGAATAGQHAAAYTGDGEADAGRLADLLRNPRWLVATAGDVLGALLQIVALSNGPVVLVQPLLVLALPIAVAIRSWFGEPRPSSTDLLNCALVILALSGFFALLGEPSRGRIIGTASAAWATSIAFVAGGLAILVVRHRSPVIRAVVFGVVAGCWFGLVSVLIEAVSSVWEKQGLEGFGDPEGFVPLVCVIGLAVVGYLLVQIGFQIGPLGASFPANLILDPVTAVVLGAVLLGEQVPTGGAKVLGYLVCLIVLAYAAVRLAQPPPAAVSGVRAQPAGTSGILDI